MAGDPRWKHADQRKRDRKYWIQQGLPCAICGKPIDYGIPFYYHDAQGKQRVNMDAFVIDEIVPVSQGGNPYDRQNQQPAHVCCNLAKGDGRIRGIPKQQLETNPRYDPKRLICLYEW